MKIAVVAVMAMFLLAPVIAGADAATVGTGKILVGSGWGLSQENLLGQDVYLDSADFQIQITTNDETTTHVIVNYTGTGAACRVNILKADGTPYDSQFGDDFDNDGTIEIYNGMVLPGAGPNNPTTLKLENVEYIFRIVAEKGALIDFTIATEQK